MTDKLLSSFFVHFGGKLNLNFQNIQQKIAVNLQFTISIQITFKSLILKHIYIYPGWKFGAGGGGEVCQLITPHYRLEGRRQGSSPVFFLWAV